MLKDKYTFDLTYSEWVQICAHIKASQVCTVIMPHSRSVDTTVSLLRDAVIAELIHRLDKALLVFRAKFRFSLTKSEAMALLVANYHGRFTFNLHLNQVITKIDQRT